MPSEDQEISERINGALSNVRGTLRIWGVWFGKSYDNIHTLIQCSLEGEQLRLYFDGGEVLSISAPRGLALSSSPFRIGDAHSTFRIDNADKVRWEWYYYGRPRVPANRYFQEFVRHADIIAATTNVDWYAAKLEPDSSSAAVELF